MIKTCLKLIYRLTRKSVQITRKHLLLRQEWEKSIKNPQEFWAEKAKAIDWFKTWDKVLDDSNKPFYKWFAGGVLNISHNALDRHVKTQRKNKLAYIWEGELGEVKTYTYEQTRKSLQRSRSQKRRPRGSLLVRNS